MSDDIEPAGTVRRFNWWWPVAGLLVGALLALLLLLVTTGRLFGPPSFNGVVIQSPPHVPDFALTAHTGEAVSLSDFQEKIVLIYFGYTYCPDACPATLSELARAMEEINERERQQVQVLMVSVDPERDSPQVLADYVSRFDPSFIGLTGKTDELRAAATPLGVFFQKEAEAPAEGYLVDHTASVAVVDRQRRLRLVYPFNTPGEAIAEDLKHLVRE